MKKNNKIFVILLALLMVFVACGPKDTPDKPAENGEATAENYKAGTYESEVEAYGGTLKIQTTLTENKIEKIEILESKETEAIGGAAIETLTSQIVDKQTLAIDNITGATVTTEAFLKAVEDTVTQAGGDVSKLKEVSDDTQTDSEAVELEADVIVVGGGGAGLSAAISAADGGAKVILVEKTGVLGGNTIRAGGPYNAVDPERQKDIAPADQASMDSIRALAEKEAKNDRHKELQEELLKDLEAYEKTDKSSLFDSNALHKLQTYDGGDYIGQLDFIEKLVDDSLATSEWMAENGVVWTDGITTVPGGLWPRAHLPENAAGGDYIRAGENKAKLLGVEILLNSPVEELLLEDGRVAGIKGTSNGAAMTIKSKAVVIATGGFAANVDMRQEYDDTLIDSLPTTNTPAATGDGIKMAEAVDAQVIGMEYIQSLPLGNPADGGLNAWVGGSGVEYYYQVNKEGQRFMAEDGRRDTMTQALLAQTDAMSYVISSAENHVEVNEENHTIWGDNIDELVENNVVFRADTIEELAEQIDIDPAILKATHDQFNAYVEAGKDEDFNRTLFGKPLVTGPFFASPRVPTVHHTMGGLRISLLGEVLNNSDQVIPGLFAAGEVTGGIHGANRLGGNALVDIHVFGRVAGESAAEYVK